MTQRRFESDYRNQRWLERQYHTLGKSAERIARECGVAKTTVLTWLRVHRIPRRDRRFKTNVEHKDYQNREWLYQKYVVERRRLTDITRMSSCEVSRTQIRYWLNRHGLLALSTPRDYEDESWLRQKYWVEGLSTGAMAKESAFSVDRKTVEYHMKRLGIPRREHHGVGARDYQSREWLEEHYVTKHMSLSECARAADPPTVAETIRDWLVFFGIRRRPNAWGKNDPKHPMRGFRHTEETRRKISGALMGQEVSTATRRKISSLMKGRKITWRQKISDAQKGSKAPWFGKRPPQPKVYWRESPDSTAVAMRSRWEMCFAYWLDQRGYEWNYEPRAFILPGGDAYTPDFYVSALDTYFEVKGWMRPWARSKIDRFRKVYPEIILVIADKHYLKAIGCDLTMEFERRDKPRIVCPVCGTPFQKRKEKQKVCSKRCGNTLRSLGTSKGSRNGESKRGRS